MSTSKRLAVIILMCFGIVLSTFLLLIISPWSMATPLFLLVTIICGCLAIGSLLYALKSVRIFATVLGLFLVGAPFILFVISYLLQYSDPAITITAITILLTAWAILSGLLTRDSRGMYWSLHLAAWSAGLGFSLASYYTYSFPWIVWLLFPLGASLVLGLQYRAVLAFFVRIGLTQPVTSPPEAAQPKEDEAGRHFTYPSQIMYEGPQAQYPQRQKPRH